MGGDVRQTVRPQEIGAGAHSVRCRRALDHQVVVTGNSLRTNAIRPRRIVVVGAGIAGLALAAALDPVSFEVSVLEAEPQRETLGAALGLWPAARRALAGIGAAMGSADRPHNGALFTAGGRRLVRLPEPDMHLVPRPALLAALRRAVPAGVRIEQQLVEDPAQFDADLVIGADGVRSRVRGLVHPAASERVESPFVTMRGLTDDFNPDRFGEYWGRRRLFGVASVTDEQAYWFTAHRSTIGPEPLSSDEVLAEAREIFAGDARVIRHTLDRCGSDTIATRLWTTPPMPRYVRDRYVVIGDAAHASLPNLGRGACDAILDAVTLAHTLNRGGSLRAWQTRRLPVTQAARLTAASLMRVATAL